MGSEPLFEGTLRGSTISKAILGLSFVLPYLIDWLNRSSYPHLMIYAPTWLLLESEWESFIGPTPMALLMFAYWLPYTYVGFQSYRFSKGKYSSVNRYVVGVVFVTSLAILLTIPLMISPSVWEDGRVFHSTVIPLPLVSILALLLIPVLRPVLLLSPWEDVKENVFSRNDSMNSERSID